MTDEVDIEQLATQIIAAVPTASAKNPLLSNGPMLTT